MTVLVLVPTDEAYYFTAGHKITGDGMEYWKWHGTLYGASFTKWFPGKAGHNHN